MSKFTEKDMFHDVAENMNASLNKLMDYIKVKNPSISPDPKVVEMLTNRFKERVRKDKKKKRQKKSLAKHGDDITYIFSHYITPDPEDMDQDDLASKVPKTGSRKPFKNLSYKLSMTNSNCQESKPGHHGLEKGQIYM